MRKFGLINQNTVNFPHFSFTGDARAIAEICRKYREAMECALSLQGPRALGSTRLAAAIHEAGHVVVYKWQGHRVCEVYVRQAEQHTNDNNDFARMMTARFGPAWREAVGPEWGGYTSTTSQSARWPSEGETRHVIAGWLAEELFLPPEHKRLASSLDELILYGVNCKAIAEKKRLDTTTVTQALLDETTRVLLQHESAVRAIANRLMETERLEENELQELLQDVRPAHCEERTEAAEKRHRRNERNQRHHSGANKKKPRLKDGAANLIIS